MARVAGSFGETLCQTSRKEPQGCFYSFKTPVKSGSRSWLSTIMKGFHTMALGHSFQSTVGDFSKVNKPFISVKYTSDTASRPDLCWPFLPQPWPLRPKTLRGYLMGPGIFVSFDWMSDVLHWQVDRMDSFRRKRGLKWQYESGAKSPFLCGRNKTRLEFLWPGVY